MPNRRIDRGPTTEPGNCGNLQVSGAISFRKLLESALYGAAADKAQALARKCELVAAWAAQLSND